MPWVNSVNLMHLKLPNQISYLYSAISYLRAPYMSSRTRPHSFIHLFIQENSKKFSPPQVNSIRICSERVRVRLTQTQEFISGLKNKQKTVFAKSTFGNKPPASTLLTPHQQHKIFLCPTLTDLKTEQIEDNLFNVVPLCVCSPCFSWEVVWSASCSPSPGVVCLLASTQLPENCS